jgi:hypothetical protein
MLPNAMKRISQIKEQLTQRGYQEKNKKKIIEETIHSKPPPLVPETTFPTYKPGPESKHAMSRFLKKQDRRLVVDGS